MKNSELAHLSDEQILEKLCCEVLKDDAPQKVSKQSPDARIFGTVLRRQQLRRAKSCEFVSPITRKRCGSIHDLEIDHKVPYSKGGKTTAQNARVLCANHNRHMGNRGAP